jgi:hypothetical protein
MRIRYLVLLLLVLLVGCGRELELRYQYDAFETVETASAYSGPMIVATAKRVAIRPVGGPTVTDIEVEETHFASGTRQVVYRGSMVFRCRTNEAFGERISDTPVFGKRGRDVFRRWPWAHLSSGP